MQTVGHSLIRTQGQLAGTAVLESSQDLHMRRLSKSKPAPVAVIPKLHDEEVEVQLSEAQLRLEAIREDLLRSIERTRRAMNEASRY